MTGSLGNVLVAYSRFLQYQDRRLKIAGELAGRAEPPTGEAADMLQASHGSAQDSVESGLVPIDLSRADAEDTRGSSRPRVPTAPTPGRNPGRRQAVDSTDGSLLR